MLNPILSPPRGILHLVIEMTNIAHKDDVGQVLTMMTIIMDIMLIMMMTIFYERGNIYLIMMVIKQIVTNCDEFNLLNI